METSWRLVLTICNVIALVALFLGAAHVYVGYRADQRIVNYHQTVIVPMTKPAPPGGTSGPR